MQSTSSFLLAKNHFFTLFWSSTSIMKIFVCLVSFCIVTCLGAPQSEDTSKVKEDIPILKNVHTEDLSGRYDVDFASKYEHFREDGQMKQLPGDKLGPVSVKSGEFTYIAPNNKVYKVTYTSDERGFVASGEHLPTPPPIPDAIKQSLELIRSQAKYRKPDEQVDQ